MRTRTNSPEVEARKALVPFVDALIRATPDRLREMAAGIRETALPPVVRMAVYENRADGSFHEFAAVLAEPADGFGWGGGVLLAGTEEVSLPPMEALELFGSPAMREVLGSTSPGPPLAGYNDGCPLYRKGLMASLGGWHIPWPEYDAYDHEAGRLVLWTFERSEPWLEVWQRPSGVLQVVPRIS